MKIVADDKIPFLHGVFEPYAEVSYLPGSAITQNDIAGADALIVRTRTHCGAKLLDGSRVRMIATATIGFDHIDAAYCAAHGIEWANAPGCNAASVAQYIASVLVRESLKRNMPLRGKTLGIIGVGHVGKLVAELGKTLGMTVLLNDPPRAEAEGGNDFLPLRQVCRESDFLTLHVPLTRDGAFRTVHLANEDFFLACSRKPFFINASRGETVSPDALTSALLSRRIRGAALDVWEDEPDIDTDLMALLDYATPHIAGYSLDGKANGTAAAVRAVAGHFGIRELENFYPAALPVPAQTLIEPSGDGTALAEAVLRAYDVLKDDARLRAEPQLFERLRGDYPLRREFPAYTVSGGRNLSAAVLKQLSALGFAVER